MTRRSRDNFPNPVHLPGSYAPLNSPALDDLAPRGDVAPRSRSRSRSIDDRDFAVARLTAPIAFGDNSIDRLSSEVRAGTRPGPERQCEV